MFTQIRLARPTPLEIHPSVVDEVLGIAAAALAVIVKTVPGMPTHILHQRPDQWQEAVQQMIRASTASTAMGSHRMGIAGLEEHGLAAAAPPVAVGLSPPPATLWHGELQAPPVLLNYVSHTAGFVPTLPPVYLPSQSTLTTHSTTPRAERLALPVRAFSPVGPSLPVATEYNGLESPNSRLGVPLGLEPLPSSSLGHQASFPPTTPSIPYTAVWTPDRPLVTGGGERAQISDPWCKRCHNYLALDYRDTCFSCSSVPSPS